MSSFVIIGGGICGMLSAALLSGDNHQVTVLERDPARPPGDADADEVASEAFTDWERTGVRQFRLGHLFLPRFYHELQKELPELAVALEAAGANKIDFFEPIPESVTGGRRPGDERFTSLTGRRPMIEAAIANFVETLSGVTIRRGTVVSELLTSDAERLTNDPINVCGVRTDQGEELFADLVIDASGRASSLPRLLVAAGGTEPTTVEDDSGFVYFGRTFSSPDGTLPAAIGGGLQHYETVSTLTLPADHGTWFCGIIAASGDKVMRRAKDPELFEKLWRSYPLVAHWHDGEPFDDEVTVMAGLQDRIRNFTVDGEPVVTGLVAVGDSWASTNPSVGRGASMGLVHSIALRDHLREQSIEDPVAFARTWWQRTDEQVRPWYDDTVNTDKYRLDQINAQIAGHSHDVAADSVEATYELMPAALMADPEVLRGYMDIFTLHKTKEQVLVEEGLDNKVRSLARTLEPPPGPSRSELEAILVG